MLCGYFCSCQATDVINIELSLVVIFAYEVLVYVWMCVWVYSCMNVCQCVCVCVCECGGVLSST